MGLQLRRVGDDLSRLGRTNLLFGIRKGMAGGGNIERGGGEGGRVKGDGGLNRQ